jgi:putative transcriptional regulator
MKRSIGKEIIEGLEDFASALEKNEDIPEKYTCRKIALDLHPQIYDPALVKKTRAILGVSQAVFAQFLGVAVKTVSSWEQGKNIPQDVACRLMDEIRHDPPYWKRRLCEVAVSKSKGTGRKFPVPA